MATERIMKNNDFLQNRGEGIKHMCNKGNKDAKQTNENVVFK